MTRPEATALASGDDANVGVECPFCCSATVVVLHTVSTQEAATHSVRPNFDPQRHQGLSEVIARLWGADCCSVVRCRNCEGAFSWPFVGGDSAFYNLAYSDSFTYPQHRWEFKVALRWIQGGATGGRPRILELGAGDGAFAKKLLGAGIAPDALWAVEYSDRARQAISRIDARIHVLRCIEDLPAFSGREAAAFSHVFAFQVMEHVSRPVEYLKAFARLLAEGGVVCLSVPNPARIEFNEREGLLLDMPPHHVSRLGVAAMSALASRAGFHVEHTEAEPFRFLSSLKEYSSYYFNRRAQSPESLQNWLERHLPHHCAVLTGAIFALPSAAGCMFGRTDGGSLFYALRKGDWKS